MFLRSLVVLFFVLFIGFKPSFATAGENGVVDFLPIGAKQMSEAGMTPPKPFFISPMYFYMEEYLNITDARGWAPDFGYFNTPDTALNVNMSNASMVSSSFGIRGGFWLLPFLQIFGLYVHSEGYTKFNAQVDPKNQPDQNGIAFEEIMPKGYSIDQRLNFKADTGVIGLNAAYGFKLGPVYPFGSLNANYAWSKANLVDKIISTVVASARVGVNVPTPIPHMDVSVWLGVMYKLTLGMSEKVSGKYTTTIPKDNFAPGLGITSDQTITSRYTATQRFVSPWNMTAGFAFNPCRYFGIMTEFGFINKFTANVGLNFNF